MHAADALAAARDAAEPLALALHLGAELAELLALLGVGARELQLRRHRVHLLGVEVGVARLRLEFLLQRRRRRRRLLAHRLFGRELLRELLPRAALLLELKLEARAANLLRLAELLLLLEFKFVTDRVGLGVLDPPMRFGELLLELEALGGPVGLLALGRAARRLQLALEVLRRLREGERGRGRGCGWGVE